MKREPSHADTAKDAPAPHWRNADDYALSRYDFTDPQRFDQFAEPPPDRHTFGDYALTWIVLLIYAASVIAGGYALAKLFGLIP